MTGRLPSLKPREVVRALQRAGFEVSRSSGSHFRLVHSADDRRKVTVPMHSEDLKRGTLRSIIAQAGFTVPEFINLL
jgi:predicted RNA binding protein YcfA (HicA-like mRNA interferase family)